MTLSFHECLITPPFCWFGTYPRRHHIGAVEFCLPPLEHHARRILPCNYCQWDDCHPTKQWHHSRVDILVSKTPTSPHARDDQNEATELTSQAPDKAIKLESAA